MNIKNLGTGCVSCQNLEKVTLAAINELGLTADVEKVTDPGEIVSWGVMSTPALVIDDEVVLAGKVPSAEAVKRLLSGR